MCVLILGSNYWGSQGAAGRTTENVGGYIQMRTSKMNEPMLLFPPQPGGIVGGAPTSESIKSGVPQNKMNGEIFFRVRLKKLDRISDYFETPILDLYHCRV